MNLHYATGTAHNNKGMPFVCTDGAPDGFCSLSRFAVTGLISGKVVKGVQSYLHVESNIVTGHSAVKTVLVSLFVQSSLRQTFQQIMCGAPITTLTCCVPGG